jgi:VWFA-related protein
MNRITLPILFLLAASALPAQQPQNPPPAPTSADDEVASDLTIKTRTDLVLIPVVVRDKQGQHVPGLTKDSFRLEENGKDQTISLFEEVQTASDKPSPAPALLNRGFSNLPFDGTHDLRLTIILFDLLNTTPLQRSDGKDQLMGFLSQGLAHNQPVSLLAITSDGLKLVQPFTSDTTALLQSLKKLPLGAQRLMPRKEAAYETLKQLREIAQAYSGIPVRKTLIFAAGNIPDPQFEPRAYDDPISALDWFQKSGKILSDANIAVYPIQLMGWAADPASRSPRLPAADSTLRQLAEATGGNRCLESNEVKACINQGVEDSLYYYMLGFSVRPDDRKPGWRDLKVKVSAEHATIRARNGFYYGTPVTPGSQPTVHDAEINALASSLAYSAIPMYVRVLPDTNPRPAAAAGNSGNNLGNKKTVEFLLTIPFSGIKIDPTGSNPMDLDVGAIALTSGHKVRDAGEFLHAVHGSPKQDALRQFARNGVIKLNEKLELPPGSYDVRFMVRDNNSAQIGTVVFPLEVK